MAAPLPPNEAKRLSVLRDYNLLDTGPEDAYDEIARLAAHICGTPIASVSLIDADRQWFKSSLGLAITEVPRAISFCAHTIVERDLLIVPDATEDPRFADNPAVTGELHVRFYAGVPLINDDGYALGTLCVVDSVPRHLTSEQEFALRALARQVVTRMELRRRDGIEEWMIATQKRVNEERESEQALISLRSSERRFRSAFSDAAVGASLYSLDGRFVSVNSAFSRITAYSEEVLRTTDFMALTHPDDLRGCLDQVARLLAGEIPSFIIEKRYLSRDGQAVWVQNSVSLLRDAEGSPEHILALSEDIRQRKDAEREEAEVERAARGSQNRTAQLLALAKALRGTLTVPNVVDAILRAVLPIFQTGKGLVVLLSEDGETLRAAQVQGLRPAHWHEFSVNAHRPLAEAVRERRLVLSPLNRVYAARHFLTDMPQDTPGVLMAIPLQGSERCIGGLGVICAPDVGRDPVQKAFLWAVADQCAIALERAQLYDAARREVAVRQRAETTLRQSEIRLAEAQRIAHIGSWEVDMATQRLTWSAEMFRLLGFDPIQGVPSYDQARSQYHADDIAERDRLYAQAITTGEPYQVEMRLLLPGGGIRWCQVIGQPELDADGRILRVAGTVQDITERVGQAQRLQDANAVLEAANDRLKSAQAQMEMINAELKALATTDPLTGLLNHRAFQTRLAEEAVRARRDGPPVAVAVLDLDGFRFFNDVYGHAVGDGLLSQVAQRLRQVFVAGEILARFGGDEFIVMLPGVDPDTTPADIEARLRRALIGLYHQPTDGATAIPVTAAVGAALYPADGAEAVGDDDPVAGGLEAMRQAQERLWRAKTGGDAETEAGRFRAHALRSLSGFSLLDALVTAVDNKDRYTKRHSEDVLTYGLMIARELGMTEAEQRTVAVAALLHDVGKIGVPDAILRKPGGLTDEEYETVRQHPQMGAIIVQSIPGLEDTLDAVCHHHERWDGGGYPFGLVGTEIPLTARLMAVADAFSAMTTDRPYRKGMDREKALSLLENGSGSQWDRHCVNAFLTAYGDSDTGIGIGA